MPVRYTITIDTENAAFEDDPSGESAAVADRIAAKLAVTMAGDHAWPAKHFAIRDTNGNLIGHILAERMAEPIGSAIGEA